VDGGSYHSRVASPTRLHRADGAVTFLEVSVALEPVDSSSGAIGTPSTRAIAASFETSCARPRSWILDRPVPTGESPARRRPFNRYLCGERRKRQQSAAR